MSAEPSPYLEFSREHWSALRASTPMTLSEEDIEAVRGTNVNLSAQEVEEVYLPLSRLLNLYVQANQSLFSVTDTFLGKPTSPVPYVIGLAGSVAVGKSTTARVLKALLSRWPDHPRVEIVTTDGFLWPNAVLEERGIMARKGFPEAYDRKRLLQFMAMLKSGEVAKAPVYSHQTYDILPDVELALDQPDIVILEGLNVLQGGGEGTYVSDYFDFSIYVDADPVHIERWFVERFFTFRDTGFKDPENYFHRYASLSDSDADARARQVWEDINLPNLRENVAPTRDRATLILEKDAAHSVHRVRLRRR